MPSSRSSSPASDLLPPSVIGVQPYAVSYAPTSFAGNPSFAADTSFAGDTHQAEFKRAPKPNACSEFDVLRPRGGLPVTADGSLVMPEKPGQCPPHRGVRVRGDDFPSDWVPTEDSPTIEQDSSYDAGRFHSKSVLSANREN